MPDAIYIVFLFLLGACIGSFLNVVVWRLPRGESLMTPPSHCPRCEKMLLFRDNLPILGWIKLGGKCRFCREPISPRYPIVEAVTALLFVFYYVMFYQVHAGPCSPAQMAQLMERASAGSPLGSITPAPLDWPMFLLYLFLVSALLAASLIDAELFIIPAKIPWLVAGVGLLLHSFLDHPDVAGALNLGVAARPSASGWGRIASIVPIGPAARAVATAPSPAAAVAAGGIIGLAISLALWWFGVLPTSFPEGEPMLEVDREALAEEIEQARREKRDPADLPDVPPSYTPGQIRREMRKEMLFLLPPLALGLIWAVLTARVPALSKAWQHALTHDWFSGLLGSLLGGLVGGGVVWLTRILGTLGFGRVAMGLGDADLMFGVGAVLGAGPAVVAFFTAPFFGLLIALYLLFTGKRREVPYGPYLSLASACVLLFYTPVIEYLAPGLAVVSSWLSGLLG